MMNTTPHGSSSAVLPQIPGQPFVRVGAGEHVHLGLNPSQTVCGQRHGLALLAPSSVVRLEELCANCAAATPELEFLIAGHQPIEPPPGTHHSYDMHGHEPGCGLCAWQREQQNARSQQLSRAGRIRRAREAAAPYDAGKLARIRAAHFPLDGRHDRCPFCVNETFLRLLTTAELARPSADQFATALGELGLLVEPYGTPAQISAIRRRNRELAERLRARLSA
jgi:hypothetical protein